MSLVASIATLFFISSFYSATALSPSCAPGGNFDLSKFNLQLPTGSTGDPTTIKQAQLAGCSGFNNNTGFYTHIGDGALVMTVPGSPTSSQCVTTKNSLHCRSELREIAPASWDPNGSRNQLNATLTVITADDGRYGTVVGQIHIDEAISSNPVAELYYSKAGDLTMGVEMNRDGGKSVYTPVGNVPVGTKFDYAIIYERNVLGVSINGGTMKVLSTNELDAPASFFKVGNYNQGDSPSEVHFFGISISH